jgi:hypothetical protein
VLFSPASPFYEPSHCIELLDPVPEYTDNGNYIKNYTMHKVGSSYRKAIGHPLLGEEIPI